MASGRTALYLLLAFMAGIAADQIGRAILAPERVASTAGSEPVGAAPAAAAAQPAGVRVVYPPLSADRAPSASNPPAPRADVSRIEPSTEVSRIEPPATVPSSPVDAPKPLDEPGSTAGAAAPDSSAGDLVDLNTGSVEEFDSLGGGRIGRAIVNGRPYAAPEDLLLKRILTRTDFERIRDRITVQ